MFCEKCGARLPDDAVFCPYCGASTQLEEPSNDNAPDEPDDRQKDHSDTISDRPGKPFDNENIQNVQRPPVNENRQDAYRPPVNENRQDAYRPPVNENRQDAYRPPSPREPKKTSRLVIVIAAVAAAAVMVFVIFFIVSVLRRGNGLFGILHPSSSADVTESAVGDEGERADVTEDAVNDADENVDAAASAVPGTDSAVASTAEDASNSLVGIFKIMEMSYSGTILSSSDIAFSESLGETLYMVFSEDRTVYMYSFGEESSGTWDQSSIIFDGDAMPYNLDGDTLTLAQDNISMTLVRTTQETIDAILANASDSAADTDDTDNASADMDDSTDSSGSITAIDGYEPAVEYSTEETVLFDTDEASMTVTGYKTGEDYGDDYYGFVVKVRCENKTSDKSVRFYADDAAIDGYEVSMLFNETVPANRISNTEIYFAKKQMDMAGISSVDELEMRIFAQHSENSSAYYYYNDTVTLYPTGKNADEIVYPERTASDSDVVVVDDDNVSFIITGMGYEDYSEYDGYEDDDDWNYYYVTVYAENKTDKALIFSWRNVAVNKTMSDDFFGFYAYLRPGQKACDYIPYHLEDLRENNITDITSIDFDLVVSDGSDWTADDLLNRSFTYTP